MEDAMNDDCGTETLEEATSSSSDDLFLRVIARDSAAFREPRPCERLGGEDGQRYEVRQKLGQGGMGWVFRAWDSVLQRMVALKCFRLPEGGAEQALHEARATARLNHENIVHIFDVGAWRSGPTQAPVPFLVVECLEGESLSALLKREPLSPERALELMIAIAAGLAHAHEHHLIHRDLKPSNVFITRDGTVKLLDFGLAHPIASHLVTPREGGTAGTPLYMAPEQWLGAAQDERTDVWAAGVVMFELLTGAPPYPPSQQLRDQVLAPEPVPSVRERRPELSRELEAFVARALAKDPSRRFQTALEFQEQLHDVQERLESSHQAPFPPTPQRRQITFVSCWLTGLAGLAEQWDSEDVGELEAAFHQVSMEMLQHEGGLVTLCLGKKVLAGFGCLHAREHESVYAVRAALRLTREFPEALRRKLPHLPDARSSVRVGVLTAQVNLNEPGGQQGAVVIGGNAPELASGLARLAEPGTVLLGETTWELVQQSFEAESLGHRHLEELPREKTLQVYRPVREREAASRFERASLRGTLTSFVGREQELRQLRGLWEQALRGGRTWALLGGEAGIGKSRLIQEFLGGLPDMPVFPLHAQCWPEGGASVFQPLIELLTRLLPLDPRGSPHQRARQVEEGLCSFGLGPEQRDLLTAFLGLPLPGEASILRLTPVQRKKQTLEALEELLTRVARYTPVIVVMEDLHWADPSTLQFLGHLLQRTGDSQVLFLLSARPGFTPPWPPRPWLHTFDLHRLSPQSTESLVKETAGGHRLSSETLQQLVAKTDGVPLFIEELTRVAVTREPREDASRGAGPPALPATLSELLLARLDGLPRRQRALARLCAIVGHDFTWALLSRLTGWSDAALRAALSGLLEEGILLEQEALEPRYQFRHILIQEVASQQLTRSTRRQHHRRIAQTLETHFPALAEARPELLAHHYTEAGEAELAIRYWAEAGERASQRAANEEAVHHLSLALQLLRSRPDAEVRTQEELRLLTSLGVPLAQLQRYLSPEVERLFERARKLFQSGEVAPPQIDQSHWGLFHYYFARAKFREAHAFGEQLVAQGRHQRSRELLTIGHRMMAAIQFNWGQLPVAREHIERALAYAVFTLEEHKALAVKQWVNPRVITLAYATIIYSVLGDAERVSRYADEALALAGQLSHTHTLAYALTHVALGGQLRRSSSQALAWAEQSVAFSQEHQLWIWLGWSQVIRSWALAGVGQVRAGLELMKTSFEVWEGSGIQLGMPLNFGIFAEMHLKLEQPEQAMEAAQRGLGWAQTTGERYYEAELYRLQGEAVRALGQEREARRCFLRARAIARRQEARLFELRAALSLSRKPRDDKRRRATMSMLRRVCDRFSSQLDSADVREAREWLAMEHTPCGAMT